MPDPACSTILDAIDVLLMAAGGIVLLIGVVRQVRRGRRDPLRGAPLRVNVLSPAWIWLVLLIYASSGLLAGGIVAVYTPSGRSTEVTSLWRGVLAGNLMQATVIAAVLWVASRTFRGGLAGFGLMRRPWRRDLGDAIRGWLVALCVCAGLSRLTEWLFHLFSPRFETPMHSIFVTLAMPETPTSVRVVTIAGAAVLAPLGEELLFRGILQTGMRRILPPRRGSLRHRWLGIVLASLVFGAMHLPTPQYVPALVVLGIILGWQYERTGSLRVPIAVHMLFNGKTLLWYHLSGG
ncbi:MAG: CPBP family intramembrane metalloprotease [Planctomycetes bacterium]|nr:CPBP family intramembrane metalloprotease [Planctomycetota bacterium]